MENNSNSPVAENTSEKGPKKEEAILNRKNIYLIAVVSVLLLAALGFSFQKKSVEKKEATIKENTEKFIKENLIQPGADFKISEFIKEGDLYKLTASVSGQNITAYVSKDGKKFFPSVIDLEKKSEAASDAPQAVTEATQKQDVPEVEAFVMSYCPYGTQIEKGILPVVNALGNKIKFSLKFVDYAMHGKKEIDENLRQYCIQKNQTAKLSSYLTCFLKKGDGTEQACMKTAGVNASQTAACMSATDKQFKITEKFNDKSTWSGGTYPPFDVDKEAAVKYGVKGSPALVVNGQTLNAGRDSASLLKAICSGFITEPKECSQSLSTVVSSPGFGEGTAPANTSAGACQ